jgi:bifunctional enzyme CysN/CysC
MTRSSLKRHGPAVLWLTGRSEPVKAEIARLVDGRLHLLQCHAFLLEADAAQGSINGRMERIRRLGEIARLMTDAGLIVVTAIALPSRVERRLIRSILAPGEFMEVYIETPPEAHRGRNGASYEAPVDAEISIDTSLIEPPEAAVLIVNLLLGAADGNLGRASARALPFDMSYS